MSSPRTRQTQGATEAVWTHLPWARTRVSGKKKSVFVFLPCLSYMEYSSRFWGYSGLVLVRLWGTYVYPVSKDLDLSSSSPSPSPSSSSSDGETERFSSRKGDQNSSSDSSTSLTNSDKETSADENTTGHSMSPHPTSNTHTHTQRISYLWGLHPICKCINLVFHSSDIWWEELRK